jgi:hypothetical protein
VRPARGRRADVGDDNDNDRSVVYQSGTKGAASANKRWCEDRQCAAHRDGSGLDRAASPTGLVRSRHHAAGCSAAGLVSAIARRLQPASIAAAARDDRVRRGHDRNGIIEA